MISRTPAELRDEIRVKYNLERVAPAAGSQAFPDDALNVFLRAAIEKYYEMLQSSESNRTLEKLEETTLPTAANVSPLPADFGKLTDGPFLSRDGKAWMRLRPQSRGFEAHDAGIRACPDWYMVAFGWLNFSPTADQTYSLRYRYSATPSVVLTGTTPILGPFGWADYVTTHVCVDLSLADGRDTAFWMGRLSSAKDTAQRALQNLDETGVTQIEDVRYDDYGPAGDLERYEWLRTGPASRRY
jgi:hypothetical protein